MKYPFTAGTIASKSIKSYVSVPVLSKQHILTSPPTITLPSSIQNIDFYFNFPIEYITPKAMLTGRAAGTVIATRSRKDTIISDVESVLRSCGSMARKVKRETKNRKNRNLADYF